jgi:hypothetical protein
VLTGSAAWTRPPDPRRLRQRTILLEGPCVLYCFYLPLVTRAAHRNRTSRDGRIRSTVTVPVPFQLNSIIETDGGRDRQHPSNPVTKRPSTVLDGIEREYPNELYLFFKPLNSLLPGVGDKPRNGRLTKIISNTVLINITVPENVAEIDNWDCAITFLIGTGHDLPLLRQSPCRYHLYSDACQEAVASCTHAR